MKAAIQESPTQVQPKVKSKWSWINKEDLRQGLITKKLPSIQYFPGDSYSLTCKKNTGGKYDIPPEELIPEELQDWFYTTNTAGKRVQNVENLRAVTIKINTSFQYFNPVVNEEWNLEDLRSLIIVKPWDNIIADSIENAKNSHKAYWFSQAKESKANVSKAIQVSKLILAITELDEETIKTLTFYLNDPVQGLSAETLKDRLIDKAQKTTNFDSSRLVYGINNLPAIKKHALLNKAIAYNVLKLDFETSSYTFDGMFIVKRGDDKSYQEFIEDNTKITIFQQIQSKLTAAIEASL